ncbi:hypothetical protein [Priestia megaterium]|uniref:hypothetical protein n=1 Tax=Priestia megaterium TaxID=1404 RepID=UPI003009D0CC
MLITWLNEETFEKLELPLKKINLCSEPLSLVFMEKELDKSFFQRMYNYFLEGKQLLHNTNVEGNLQLIIEIGGIDLNIAELLTYNWCISFKQEQERGLRVSFLILDKEDTPLELPFIFNFNSIEERYNIAALCEQPEIPLYFLQKINDKLILQKNILVIIPDPVRELLREQLANTYQNVISEASDEMHAYQIIVKDNKSQEVKERKIGVSQYGLNESSIYVKYNVDEKRIVHVEGITSDDVYASKANIFNNPACIFVEGIPLYPSKYEIVPSGDVIFHSKTRPTSIMKANPLLISGSYNKEMQEDITIQGLRKYNTKGRTRIPSQNQVMGESSHNHINKLVQKNMLVIDEKASVTWHWCHLIAFSMLPNERAQIKENMVCGTAAFNGQMTNVEQAVKTFIYNTKRPLKLEVTADLIAGTHVATRVRYRIYDLQSQRVYTEYYNPLSTSISDILDEQIILINMEKKFIDNGLN